MILTGTYTKTIYRNNKSGYTCFYLKCDTADDTGQKFHNCAGYITHYAEGMPLQLEGEKIISKGREIFQFEKAIPNIKDEAALLAFLQAYLPNGHGSVCAEKVVGLLRDLNVSAQEFFEKEDAAETLIEKIKGFTEKSATVFINKILGSINELNLLNELSKYGVSYIQVHKLYLRYGLETEKTIERHPYISMCSEEIPFSCADIYGKEHGLGPYHPERISCLVSLTYSSLADMGETFASFAEIMKLFRRIENQNSRYNELIPDAIVAVELFKNRDGLVDDSTPIPRFYTKASWDAEESILRHLKRLRLHEEEMISLDTTQDYLKKQGSFLDQTQKEAFKMLDKTDTTFLIGGPGTGKTTVIKQIVECCKTCCPDKNIVLCAPTGRAAERIKEATGYSASTIHMLLEYRMEDGIGRPNRNINNPIDADFLIVDEFSMVGIYLFAALLDAVPSETKLLLVGDWNQLQPIEPGFLLHDLVNSGKFRYTELKNTHRQHAESSILINRDHILRQELNLMQDGQCLIYHMGSEAEAKTKINQMVLNYNKPSSLQSLHVVTPQKRGSVGTYALNDSIQSLYHKTDEPHFIYGDECFYIGDKVMTTRNHYPKENDSTEYYNGDLWQVKDYSDAGKLYLISEGGNEICLEGECLDDVTLAYAMTVHKCQGSEGETVLLALPGNASSRMISRSLLYTAVTRPKDRLIIVSAGSALENFILSPMHANRNSDLSGKLQHAGL